MRLRFPAVAAALLGLAALLAVPVPAPTQDPGKPPDNYEVLARGPVHEAYAEPMDYRPEAGPVASKVPPEPIDEVPPDQRPEGDDVEWMPGYWAWEEEDKEFLWVSGFWRDTPPDRRWVPGTWQEAEDGWHWTPGFWAPEEMESVEYTPPPPPSIDAGPSTPPAQETHAYVPGCWLWREARFFWRPGFWVEYRPDWVWVPARYAWTPGGCVFVEGYWDRPLHMRGLLFAPIRMTQHVTARRFTYVPQYVIRTDFLMTAMFVGPARRHYYFGDYFEERYERRGFVAWINYQPSRRTVDPVWGYYRATYRQQPAWHESLANVYRARRSGEIARPPRTLVQQNTVINNITVNKSTNVNVTNTVNITNIQNVSVVAPVTQINNTEVTALADLAPAAKGAAPAAPKRVVKMQQINVTQVNEQRERAQQVREVSKRRQQVEAKLVEDGGVAAAPGGKDGRPRPAARTELPKPGGRAAASAKKDTADPTPAPKRPAGKAPPPPPVPKTVEREAPKAAGDAPRPIRPPAAGRKKVDPAGKDDPGARKKDDRPAVPKKDMKDDPQPRKKDDRPGLPPKKDLDDDPAAKKKDSPRPKAKDDPARPKNDDDPPGKKGPPRKADKDDDPSPPAKKGPPPKKEPPKKDDDSKKDG